MNAHTRVNNHMKRPLTLRRPRETGRALLIAAAVPGDNGDVTIPPGGSADIDFWDAVKDHEFYQNLLDRGLIGIGREDDAPGGEAFTTYGDTLAPPATLDPERAKEEARQDPALVDLAYGGDAKPAPKRRGRKPKTEK